MYKKTLFYEKYENWDEKSWNLKRFYLLGNYCYKNVFSCFQFLNQAVGGLTYKIYLTIS